MLNEFLPGWENTTAPDNTSSSNNVDSGSHRTANSQSPPPQSPEQILNEEFENILYEVLVSDTAKQLMSLLKDWQKLDIVDVEGAGLIYQRLIHLCDGSHKEAQSLIDNIHLKDLKKSHDNDVSSRTLPPLLELSPFSCDNLSDGSYGILFEFCQDVYEFQKALKDARPDLPDESFMNTKREELLLKVKKLPIDACIFLLRNWMLSLAMCDVSIYITLQPLHDDKDYETDHQTVSVTLKNGRSHNFVLFPAPY